MPKDNTAIKRGRKFDQVLDGARRVFMSQGFEGASVDEIAKAAGVSKATLYSYFPDKRLLFAEVAKAECTRQAEDSLSDIDMTAPPDQVLYNAGGRLIGFLTSRFGQQVVAICCAESGRFPELGQMFYESGPGLVRNHLSAFLSDCNDNGTLEIENPLLAADQFAELCKARIFPRMMCGVQNSFDPAELDEILSSAVRMFMARYSPAMGA